ncbi:glycosyltransferase family 9 protein [Paludibacterium yongneupense]|uniref:glycosyltransferase family 9 protein n=1 Tax=Paludibacterium yongneupense TaxID=400061 RepID=UPI000401A6C3|nr:glycosyltransferase family 9 protein [Paludibacterium yongneupense]
MKKTIKIALANFIVSVQQKIGGRLRPRETLTAASEFNCIAIYSTTALGDFMFNTPAIRQLRLRYPAAKLVLVGHEKYRDLFENYGDVDAVVYWDGKLASILPVIFQLRRLRVDLGVILHSRDPYDIMSAALAGCRYILRDNYGNGLTGLDHWLASYVRNFRGHVIQRKLNVISVLGCKTDQREMVPLGRPARRAEASPDRIRVGFQLGASKPDRCWPIASFIELAQALIAGRPEMQIVLMGSPLENDLERQFMAAIGAQAGGQVESLVGKTTIVQAFEAIADLDVLVTGDTGPLHLAIALKVRTVSLFTTAVPAETGPLQDLDLHTIIHVPPGADAAPEVWDDPMPLITAARVYPAVLQALRDGGRSV